MTRLTADFNMIDEYGRIWLPDAEQEAVSRGQEVILTDGEIEVVAVLAFDAGRKVWLGVPNVETLRSLQEAPGLPSQPTR